MNPLDTGRSALRSLRANKLRSALTALGIIIGVAAVITMLAVGEGARIKVAEQLKSLGTNLMMVLPGTVTSSGVRISSYGRNTLTEADARAIQDEVPFVVAAAPALRGSGQLVHGNLNWPSQIYGVTPDYLASRDWPLASGRALDENDLRASAKVAVVGQTLRVKFVPFTIVGLLDAKGRNADGLDQDDIVLIPLSTSRGRILWQPPGRLRTVGQISVKMADGADMKQGEAQVRELLRQRHRLQPDQDDDFNIRNLADVVKAEQAAAQVLSNLLAAVASVSLLVGGIGIMNIMLVSVTERTREIGIRLAVGARQRDILAQFLAEAVILSLVGALAGIALGVAGTHALAHFADWNVALRLDAILISVISASVVGVFFGWYPARKASRMAPIEALRYE